MQNFYLWCIIYFNVNPMENRENDHFFSNKSQKKKIDH